MGRLHLDERRPEGRVHVLVHERVLRTFGDAGGSETLADAHRRVQVPGLHLRHTTARARFARARAVPTARVQTRAYVRSGYEGAARSTGAERGRTRSPRPSSAIR